ncbi:MAG: PIN domain-containing protein [Candidatus Micrarchaeota archaeon]
MKLVVDANVLFAALLTEGGTRKLLFDPRITLIAPRFTAEEFLLKKPELLQKAGCPEKELDAMLATLLEKIMLVNDAQLKPFLLAAASLTTGRKDWLYLATALHANAELWSHDRQLHRQARVKCWNTKELMEKLGLR